ncbi:redoxin domain-containing protein [Sporosarcina siberiensis]|uniref:Redoxin domain-containing protein n=1 Tax=Sporosarcina siberiensis TaxID=1365606 RepID=A0ABW4SGH9_9BACL
MKKNKLTLFLFTLISVVFLFACGNSNSSITNKGDQAPMFVIEDLAGNQIALEDLAGEKVYIKYWASWCSICLAGLDELNTLAAQENDFKILTIVSPDFKGEKSASKFSKWYPKLSADNLTVLLDMDGKWAKQFGILAYPTSYFIGSDGILAKTTIGHVPNETIIKDFETIN